MESLGKRRDVVLDSMTIRIWDGCKVLQLVTVNRGGGSSVNGSVGGAENSSRVDIEIDPWAGLIVDNNIRNSPYSFRELEE